MQLNSPAIGDWLSTSAELPLSNTLSIISHLWPVVIMSLSCTISKMLPHLQSTWQLVTLSPNNYAAAVSSSPFSLHASFSMSLLAFSSCSATPAVDDLVYSCDHKLWPLTLTSDLDLDRVKVNEHVKHLGQMTFNSKVNCPQTQTKTGKRSNWTTQVLVNNTLRSPYHCRPSVQWMTRLLTTTLYQLCVAGCWNIRIWATPPESTCRHHCYQTPSVWFCQVESTSETAVVCRHCGDPWDIRYNQDSWLESAAATCRLNVLNVHVYVFISKLCKIVSSWVPHQTTTPMGVKFSMEESIINSCMPDFNQTSVTCHAGGAKNCKIATSLI